MKCKSKINFILPAVLSIGILSGCGSSENNQRTVTIHYYDNIVRKEVLNVGDKFEEPTQPMTEAYNFAGWYFNPAFSSTMQVLFPITIVDDVEIYGDWVIKTFLVHFVTNNDYGPENETVLSATWGSTTHSDGVFIGSKEGYEFDCWCKDKELTTKFNFFTKIYEETYIYGRWKKVEQ